MRSESDGKLFGDAEGMREEMWVEDLEYTQPSCGKCFKNGAPLEHLIDDLNSGRVDPLKHPNLQLEVVEVKRGGKARYYSNDNRRLYCLKQHQKFVKPNKVMVSVKMHVCAPAFDRLLQRLPEREQSGYRRDYIRVRGRMANDVSVPPWKKGRSA